MNLRIDVKLPRLPSTIKLADALRISRREATGLIVELWAYALDQWEGELPISIEAQKITDAVGWYNHPPQQFVDILLSAGILKSPGPDDGGSPVTDTMEFAGFMALNGYPIRERRRKRKRERKARGVLREACKDQIAHGSPVVGGAQAASLAQDFTDTKAPWNGPTGAVVVEAPMVEGLRQDDQDPDWNTEPRPADDYDWHRLRNLALKAGKLSGVDMSDTGKLNALVTQEQVKEHATEFEAARVIITRYKE